MNILIILLIYFVICSSQNLSLTTERSTTHKTIAKPRKTSSQQNIDLICNRTTTTKRPETKKPTVTTRVKLNTKNKLKKQEEEEPRGFIASRGK
ncbi:hypothetical protein HCN44_010479 [Aphidius gifuensis]|uniref:Venom protein n=1 Tax=Aphidius gifuensis TaxID=684658 RepID=A0A834XQQ9_APHGI|nr:hypothetical protein HCN44_010479 [Aphidius gifuensis]